MVKWWSETQNRYEFDSRQDFLYVCAKELFNGGLFSKNDLVIAEERFENIVTGYFILSERYKKRRIRDGARTKNPKIAALFTLSILTFDPIYNVKPPLKFKNLLANEIFSLIISSVIVNFKINVSTVHGTQYWLRIAEQLRFSRLNFEGLARFRVDCFNGNASSAKYDDYIDDLSDKDMEYIITIMNLYESLEHLKI
jgi:hypothetical protein